MFYYDLYSVDSFGILFFLEGFQLVYLGFFICYKSSQNLFLFDGFGSNVGEDLQGIFVLDLGFGMDGFYEWEWIFGS